MDAQELSGEWLEFIKKVQEENKMLQEELAAMARHYNKPQPNTNLVNHNQEQFSTGAVRRKTLPCRLDLIPLEALEAMGDRLHYGATVRGYGERNWEKGIDYANLIQHAQTHTSKFAAQVIHNPIFHPGGSLDRNQAISESEEDGPYGNACAALWNWMAIVTFLRRGNPAERKP